MTISNRLRISLRRWGSILALGVIAAVVFEVSLAVGWYYVRTVPDLTVWFSSWFLCVAIFAALVFLAFLAAEPIRFRLRHIPRLPYYPPLWLSVVLGIGFALVFDTWLPPLQAGIVPSWRQLGVLGPLVIIAVIAVWIRRLPWRPPARLESVTTPPNPLTWHVVQAWSRREEPLTNESDLLGHEPIAERIHHVIVQPQERAIALVGPVGSGKTSILNMVRQRLRNKEGSLVILADVNCWAMPRPQDAPRIVLERAISALDEFVDTQALRGLPRAYQQILSAEPTGTITKMLSIGRTTDAADQLSRLTPVLEVIDARLFLVIEDAERAGHPFETRHLERLLWTLRNVERVSFILSFDLERASFDYRKLCDIIERVPRLTVDQVEDILAPAYEHWRTVTEGYIDPLPEPRQDRLGLEKVTNSLTRYMRRLDGDNIGDAITDLLTTPRNLKHFTRDVEQAWEALRGEVELDDLIVLTALRHGAPEAFDFLVANAETARSERREEDQLAGTAEKTVRVRWEHLRSSLSNPTEVQVLVNALELPQLNSDQVMSVQSSPQGIHNDGPVDYLGRMLAGQLPPGEIRDQEILRDIEGWKRSDSAQMLERLVASTPESEQYAKIWEHYTSHLSDDQLVEIATGLIAGILNRLKGDARMKHPAMLSVWRRCTGRLPRDARTEWLIEQIRIVLPINLGFATDLFKHWASVHGIVSAGHRDRVRIALVEKARTSFVTVDALLSSLDSVHEYPLTRLINPPPLDEPPDPIPWNSWSWLVPLIIEAAKVDEARIIPDVAIFVGDISDSVEMGRFAQHYKLKRERMAEFFGGQTDAMLGILAEYGGDHRYALAAKEEATQWIEERLGESGD